MPSRKNIEDRLDNVCNSIIQQRDIIIEYATDSHAVNVEKLILMANNLESTDIDSSIIDCENSIRILNAIQQLLREEKRRRQYSSQLEDVDKAIGKKTSLLIKNQEKRRRERLNPYNRLLPSTSAPSSSSMTQVLPASSNKKQ
jgi:hypothetical protein